MMAKCDLCGGACRAADMETLLKPYQIPGVAELCPKCRRWADSQKSQLLDDIAPRMRSLISDKKGVPLPTAPHRWLARFRRAIVGVFSV